jgi:hypothetical protein
MIADRREAPIHGPDNFGSIIQILPAHFCNMANKIN